MDVVASSIMKHLLHIAIALTFQVAHAPHLHLCFLGIPQSLCSWNSNLEHAPKGRQKRHHQYGNSSSILILCIILTNTFSNMHVMPWEE